MSGITDQQLEGVQFQLWHKPFKKGSRWRKVGEPTTRAEAVRRCNGKGSWWLAELRDPRLVSAPGSPSGTHTTSTNSQEATP